MGMLRRTREALSEGLESVLRHPRKLASAVALAGALSVNGVQAAPTVSEPFLTNPSPSTGIVAEYSLTNGTVSHDPTNGGSFSLQPSSSALARSEFKEVNNYVLGIGDVLRVGITSDAFNPTNSESTDTSAVTLYDTTSGAAKARLNHVNVGDFGSGEEMGSGYFYFDGANNTGGIALPSSLTEPAQIIEAIRLDASNMQLNFYRASDVDENDLDVAITSGDLMGWDLMTSVTVPYFDITPGLEVYAKGTPRSPATGPSVEAYASRHTSPPTLTSTDMQDPDNANPDLYNADNSVDVNILDAGGDIDTVLVSQDPTFTDGTTTSTAYVGQSSVPYDTSGVADGNLELHMRLDGPAGSSAVRSDTILVDRTAPNSTASGDVGAVVLNGSSVNVTESNNEAGSGFNEAELYMGSPSQAFGPTGQMASDGGMINIDLNEIGTWTFAYRGIDEAGNLDPVPTPQVTIEVRDVPILNSFGLQDGTAPNDTNADTTIYTNSPQVEIMNPDINGTADVLFAADDLSGGSTTQYNLPGSTFVYNLNGGPAEGGLREVMVTVGDTETGGMSITRSRFIYCDTESPNLTLSLEEIMSIGDDGFPIMGGEVNTNYVRVIVPILEDQPAGTTYNPVDQLPADNSGVQMTHGFIRRVDGGIPGPWQDLGPLGITAGTFLDFRVRDYGISSGDVFEIKVDAIDNSGNAASSSTTQYTFNGAPTAATEWDLYE